MDKIPNGQNPEPNKIPNWTIREQTKSRLDKIHTSKIRIEQNSELTKSRIRRNPKWKKSRIGLNPDWKKIPTWANPESAKIPNQIKSRVEPTSEIDKVRNNNVLTAGLKALININNMPRRLHVIHSLML